MIELENLKNVIQEIADKNGVPFEEINEMVEAIMADAYGAKEYHYMQETLDDAELYGLQAEVMAEEYL